jgi:GT2 family glycosyltransferase
VERLTIILPTYDRRHVLERTLPGYQASARLHRLLVIDDGSHDGTSAWLRAQGIEVVRQPRRRGLPAARNLGLALADTPWVLFGEDDVLMAADHGAALLRAAARLASHAPVGAVAGRLFPGTSWTLPATVPGDAPQALLDGRYLTGEFAAPLPRDRPLPSLHACALVRRDAALAVGGYDERFTDSAFREESDFYARLWRAGYACWLTPDSWAIHVRHRLGGGCRGSPGTLAKLASRASYLVNNARYVQRHARMWTCWGAMTAPGICTVRWARRIASQAWSAWRSP